MKTATEEKPDLTEKLTIRVSLRAKQRLREICRKEYLDEALVARIALEAGLSLCENGAIEGAIGARRGFLAGKAKSGKAGK